VENAIWENLKKGYLPSLAANQNFWNKDYFLEYIETKMLPFKRDCWEIASLISGRSNYSTKELFKGGPKFVMEELQMQAFDFAGKKFTRLLVQPEGF